MKNVAVLMEDRAFALFFCLHPGGFDSSRFPAPKNLLSKANKVLMPRGQLGLGTRVEEGGGRGESWAQLELTDAEDWFSLAMESES